MKQPELGAYITTLRNKKGLTQKSWLSNVMWISAPSNALRMVMWCHGCTR